MMKTMIAAACLLAAVIAPAVAHDSWVSRGQHRNPAGEWCCGAGDCGIMSEGALHAGEGGYTVRGTVTYGEGATGNAADGPTRVEQVNEFWPYKETQPSPDGANWRCHRPDGTPRCKFVAPPGS